MVGIAGGIVSPPRLIRADDVVSDFACGEPALDAWLKTTAFRAEGRTARTYVVSNGGVVVAYYCLATGAVARDLAPSRIRRNAPDPIPLLVIGRFAVSTGHQGRGLGGAMLGDALRRATAASDVVGISALLVHAIDDRAVAFYERYGFVSFPAGSRTLYLPIEAIRARL